MTRTRLVTVVVGFAALSAACAGILGIEEITNDPPGELPDGSIGPDGEPINNDSGTDSNASDTGTDAGDAGPDVVVVIPNSCVGLASNCGPANNDDCCRTLTVDGGTFNRSNNAAAPATVPEFKLDKYEVTVGRFRKFVGVYQQNMTPANAGSHPGIANSGWQAAFNAQMPANAAALTTALACPATAPSVPAWTAAAAANERLPINCVTWLEAFAFCIWDGGFLATEAEWNYAAAGGTDQRVYAWGNTPVASATHAICGDIAIGNVGSKSTNGDGKFGHVDLIGSVSEWVLDQYLAAYPTPCNNCAQIAAGDHVRRGGDLTDTCADTNNVSSLGRRFEPVTDRRADTGIRCARLK